MKTGRILFIIAFVITALSCDTDIPETDTTAPEFRFEIIGDGFEYAFTQQDDFDTIQLNLKSDAVYDFIYSGSDQGGVKLIQWQLPSNDNIEYSSTVPSNWTMTTLSPLSRMIQWQGNASNPLTGNIIAGTFQAKAENISDTFRFFVSDFGGESNASNNVSKALTIYVGNHNTETIEF